MSLEFKPGDLVKLTSTAIPYYGGVYPHYVPMSQGSGGAGTVRLASEDRPHKPGADPRPYYVKWDNGYENSYRVGDLEAANI